LSYQALPLEIGQGCKLFLDRALVWFESAPDAQIDHIERIHAEVTQVVVDGAREGRSCERRNPPRIRTARRADLGHDHEVIGIGIERLANELVSDVRAIVIAGVDVVDAPGDSLAKSDSRVAILRRAEHAGPSELQCAVPHAVYGTVAQGENA